MLASAPPILYLLVEVLTTVNFCFLSNIVLRSWSFQILLLVKDKLIILHHDFR